MSYRPHKKQAEAHRKFLLEGQKRGVLLWGRQSGKTLFSVNHGWLAAAIKQGRYFIVFKTYKQAHEVVWRQYVNMIPQELIYKKNEADLLIEFNYLEGQIKLPGLGTLKLSHDETKPRSSLQLLGSDQADSHRGFKSDGIIFDEYADQDPSNWDAVYKHFFTTTNGWAIFMGTPKGYNHFYDLVQFAKEDERWFYQQATWRDSPYVKAEFIEEEKQEAIKKGTLSTFLQEVELEFRSVQGAVYPSFNRDLHMVKPSQIPQEGTVYACVDFGWHTTAVLFVKVDYNGTWWVYDEIYAHEMIMEDIIPIIRDKLQETRLQLMVGDSAQMEHITSFQRFFPIVPVSKMQDSISMGINLVNQMLTPRIAWDSIDEPKPKIFIGSNCQKFIKEFEGYKYPEEKADRNPSEQPVKKDDHGPDALRYLALHLKYGTKQDTTPFKKPQFNEFGLL